MTRKSCRACFVQPLPPQIPSFEAEKLEAKRPLHVNNLCHVAEAGSSSSTLKTDRFSDLGGFPNKMTNMQRNYIISICRICIYIYNYIYNYVAGATRVENKSLQRGTTKMLRAPTLKQWHPVPPNLVHFSIRRPRLFPTCVTLSQGPMQVTTSNLCSWLRCLADHALNVWMEHIQGFIGFSHWSIFSVECVSGFVTGCRWMCLWLHI